MTTGNIIRRILSISLVGLFFAVGGCEASCEADTDNDIGDAIEDVGDEIEDATDG